MYASARSSPPAPQHSLPGDALPSYPGRTRTGWNAPASPGALEIPLVAIVQFRAGKLVCEHIYWDQASVLVQIGKLDPTGLPTAGAETARKVLDRTLPSNRLMGKWASSEGKPL